jgi:regulator of protease activity HflC (stomatin/prohibitin superfamily)
MVWGIVALWVVVGVIVVSLRVVKQYENLVILTLGKYTGTYTPGLRLVVPLIQTSVRVDLRIRTIDIPKQQMMTEDNVPVSVNGVIYFKVSHSEDAVLKVQDYEFAISQYAETALRDVIGGLALDSVLSQRDMIGDKIRDVVAKETKGWGLSVEHIKLQDVEVPDDLKRIMSRQAAAEREKRANVIKSEGDKIAAKNLAEAAKIMRTSDGAMQLRTLQTVDGLGPTPSNTVVLAVPVELMEALKTFSRKK